LIGGPPSFCKAISLKGPPGDENALLPIVNLTSVRARYDVGIDPTPGVVDSNVYEPERVCVVLNRVLKDASTELTVP